MYSGHSMRARSIRVAAVQAVAATGDHEYRNVVRLIGYARGAASNGARLICFPEAYPGRTPRPGLSTGSDILIGP
jgi:predicted amidohydrolase